MVTSFSLFRTFWRVGSRRAVRDMIGVAFIIPDGSNFRGYHRYRDIFGNRACKSCS